MNNIEQVKIEHLVEKDNSPGERLESSDLKKYFDDLFFENLKEGKVKIKKQGDLYIFEQKDPNAVRVDSEGYLIKKFSVKENVLKAYLSAEAKREEVALESDALLSNFFNTININQDLSGFQTEIISESADMLNIDNLINEYKKYLTYQKSDIINNSRDGRSTLKELQKEAEYRIKILEGIKTDLGKSNNIDIYLRDINICKNDITDFEHAKQKALLGENANVPRLLHDKRSIDKYNIELKNQTILAEKINKVLKNIAANKLFLNDQEGLREYLYAVYHGEINPSSNPFYAKHQADFVILKAMDESLYKDIMKKRPKTTRVAPGTYYMEGGKVVCYQGDNITRKNSSGLEKGGNLFSDALVKLGLIDENDTTKKEAWGKFGKVGIIGLGLFALYKIITSKGKDRWGWLIGSAGGLLALNNADKIGNWFKDAFGKTNPSAQNIVNTLNIPPEISERYVLPQANTARAIGGIPINTLISGNLLEESGGKIRINESDYKDYINNSPMGQDEKNSHIKAMEELKNNNQLHESLDSMGINSISDLQTIAGSDPEMTLIDTDNFSNYFRDLTKPTNADLAREGLKPKDAKSRYKIMKDSPDGKISNEKLAEWIMAGYLQLSENKNYNIEDLLNYIDLNSKTMNDFKSGTGQGIPFQTYKELFDAVNLSNTIIDIFKDKTAKTENPFHERLFGIGNIQFDNEDWYAMRNIRGDTDVVRSNPIRNTLREISQTLNSNSGAYVNYLNARRKAAGGKVEGQS